MICPECGCADAQVIKEIRYPKGTVTQVLECPGCNRIVLTGCLEEKTSELP